MTMTREYADRLLEPYKPMLAEAIAGGFDDYLKYPAAVRSLHTRRTVANNVHDHIVARVQALFDSVPSTRCYRRFGGFYLSIEGKVVIRFKKLDQNLRTRNILTQQVLDFLFQAPDILDISASAPTNLHAGYQLNELHNAIQSIYVTCPAGHGNDWEIDLPIPAPAVTAMPAAAQDDVLGTPEVRPRPAAEEQDADTSQQ